MGAGSVLYMTGKANSPNLAGWLQTMPPTFILYMVGGLCHIERAVFSGFVSKSIIVSAAGEEHLMYAWLLLTLVQERSFP